MLFDSIDYFIFFPIVIAIYYALKPKYRWVVLVIASYVFYMSWKPVYILLIITSTLVDYYVSNQIARSKDKAKRKLLLLTSLSVNLGILSTFKYYNFFSDSISTLFATFSIDVSLPTLNILLPIGISFYTFQTLAYTIDVYRKKIKPEKSLGYFATYVAFFPQLIAGPIERASHLIPQLHKKIKINKVDMLLGFELILWGLFKKIVISNRLALYADQVFDNINYYSGSHVAIATFFYTFQIFCDFSGYSDIAIGSARILGIDIMQNFKRPYFAKSLREFWKRWHISLSTWFRDYLPRN